MLEKQGVAGFARSCANRGRAAGGGATEGATAGMGQERRRRAKGAGMVGDLAGWVRQS